MQTVIYTACDLEIIICFAISTLLSGIEAGKM